ncbi:MAG: T9SS type A sorting domain-containing protein [Bacteroidota bacterium]
MMKRSFLLLFCIVIPGLTINAQVDTISRNIYQYNGKLGIGAQYPTSGITLKMNEPINYPAFGIMSIMNNHYATFDGCSASDIHYVGSLFNGRRSRGTLDYPLNVMPGDRLTGITAAMYLNDAWRFSSSILFYAGQGLDFESYPSYIVFNTTAANEAVYTERMRLAGNGYLGLGTTGPASKLHIADGDIYIQDIDRGIIMKSPDGQCWRGVITNTGTLNFTPVDCPEELVSVKQPAAAQDKVSVYPNPAGNLLSVDTGSDHPVTLYYTISGAGGKMVIRGELSNGISGIDISGLAAGVYIITLVDGAGKTRVSRQFIKA